MSRPPELLIFVGLQGAGKSSFYAEHFLGSHLRLSRDLLRTANREDVLLHAALALGQPVVLDNTHLRREGRIRRVRLGQAAGYRVVGVFFDLPVAVALERNAQREGAARVPDRAILGAAAKLEWPQLEEGFDALFRVYEEGGARRVEVTHDPSGRGLLPR